MTITSTLFLVFMLFSTLLYYRISADKRWCLLLVSSIIFYCSYEWKALFVIVFSTLLVYLSSLIIEKLPKETIRIRKAILLATICILFGILCLVKCEFVPFLVLGVSFFTFQIVGYLLDVYWNRDSAEKNFLKLLLFAIYFPQIIQGPISRHKDLSNQFTTAKYDFLNIKYGIQLIIWGLFKKIVIAETIATPANEVLHNPNRYSGIPVLVGILSYCIELYCDFSGGIDIVRGCSEIYGIKLIENFRQPFFSQSIAEFWRRWHITLGSWMRDYVFYPMALSKAMNKLGKACQNKLGRVVGRKIPMAFENIVVFILVGLWHGSSLHFIVYGLYNGIIIAFSILMEPLYNKINTILHIKKDGVWMKIFRIIRTFILVNIGWYFDDVKSLSDSRILLKNTLISTNYHYDGVTYLGLLRYQYMYVIIGCCILFTVSILRERGMNVRKEIDTLTFPMKMVLWIVFILMIPLMGWDPSATIGFMYANF